MKQRINYTNASGPLYEFVTFYHRLLYKWTVHGKSPSVATTLRNFAKFDHSFSHGLYLVTCSMRVPVFLVRRSQVLSKVLIYPYPISEGRRNCSSL